MRKKMNGKLPCPPTLKLLLRGYMIIAFILLMAHYKIIPHTSFLIFLVTVVSIAMVFGIGYLLVMTGRPVRASNFDIPNTALFFAKGIMVLYFVSLLAEFNVLPERITSMLMLGTAGTLVLVGAAGYLYEVLNRSRPLPARKSRPRTR